MKKFLAIIAMMVTMLCGSIMLVSCSNNYKKMYLVVEYALPGENGEVEWHGIDLEKGLSYTISEDLKSLNMRVRVEGTSKKVDSLYISQSVNSATFLQTSSAAPNEAFKVIVKNTGSVRFTITPSQGGADKAVSFSVNIYKQIESISQNANCVPAMVAGGSLDLGSLTDLIRYEPFGKTNQTGVDFVISGVGTLKADSDPNNLLEREFKPNDKYVETPAENLSKNVVSKFENGNNRVALEKINNRLVLTTRNTESNEAYTLNTENNVIELTATSIWNEKLNKTDEDKIECKVYVYLVENIKDALLVSYNENKDEVYDANNGNKITAETEKRMEVGDTIVLYNSAADLSVVDTDFSSVKLYTYMNPSIYSFETNPGTKLNVYFNGKKYNYSAMPDNRFGVQVNPITDDSDKLIGLKFAVNPNSISSVTKYNTKIEVEFDAFDFSASDKNPEVYLTKEFVINIETLASGFNINQRSYQHNFGQLNAGGDSIPYITELDSNEIAKLFTSYEGSKGMPLMIQSTPTGAMNETVYMGIYEGFDANGKPIKSNDSFVNGIELVDRYGFAISKIAKVDGFGSQFEIKKDYQRSAMYLRFNPTLVSQIPDKVEYLYMVCHVLCTPTTFGYMDNIQSKYITFVSKIKLVGAVDDIGILKGNADKFDEENNLVEYNKTNTALINLTTPKLYNVDLSQIKITSENNNIEFYVNSQWVKETTADKLSDKAVGGITYKELKYRSTIQCKDAINVISKNGKSATVQLEFVSVTSKNGVEVRYDDSDIWTYKKNGEVVTTELKYKDKNTDLQLSYLAIQSGGSAQFMVCGDGKSVNIQSSLVKSLTDSSEEYWNILQGVEGSYYANSNITSFNSSAVRVTPIGGNVFDIKANSGGTSIVFVKADFYAKTGDKIELQSKYFVFEIATYTPARDIRVSELSGKDSIIYINENYLDVAQLQLEIKLNGATQQINFSDPDVNTAINVDYGDNNNKSIYGIKVDYSDLSRRGVFAFEGLNDYDYDQGKYISLASKVMTVRATKKLGDFDSGIIKFKVVQFGEEKEVTEVKYVVKAGSHKPAETVVIESGVQLFNNVYLSLLDEKSKSANIVAYATNNEGDATYTELGYAVEKLVGNEYKEYTGSNLKVAYNKDSNLFTISADTQGGVYKIVIYPKDSAEGAKGKVKEEIKVTVSDGKTEATAYLINNIIDFTNITIGSSNTYYRLSSDIDFDINHLSTQAEKDALTGWWKNERQFNGHLNGQMVIENLGTNAKITRNYALKNVSVSNSYQTDSSDNIGLFTNVLGTASIKNVIFENAKISVDATTIKTTTANIGIITAVNNGTIENCSIMLALSNVSVSNLDITTINLGLVAGQNNAKIIYNSSNNTSNYSYIVDCASGAKLNIEAAIGGTINVGGIAGINKSEISANYDESKGVSVRELINAVVDIEAEITSGTLNLGGLVGQNDGTIKKITVTGALVATGNKDNVDCKVNVGGVAGQNAGIITEVVNLGADITGNEGVQNVGGIIGYNTAANVDNVRVMFIAFDSSEVKVNYDTAIIKGQGNVGGIIGATTDTQLTRAFVENFIVDGINIEGEESATVAGLVASGSANATLCFVQANVAAGDDKFNAFGSSVTPKYSYFVGQVNTIDTVEYYDNKQTETEVDKIAINEDFDEVDIAGISNDGKVIDKFYINWKKDDNINSGYPYLVYKIDGSAPDYTYTLTKAPQEIIVNVDNKYFDVDDRFIPLTTKPTDWGANWKNYYKKDADRYVKLTGEDAPKFEANPYYTATHFRAVDGQGLYMQYEIDDNIVASAVVYYDANKGDNIYKLVSDGNGAKGLIEQTIVPSIADGDYSVSVVEGGSFATLSGDNKTIKFTGTGRVVLRFVSMYDRNVTDTVVIYVEKPLDNEVFDITTSAGLKLTTEGGTDYSTRVGTVSTLGIKLKGDAGNTFDSTKLYMTAKIIESTYSDKLTINGTTANIGKTLTGLDKYLLGQFEVYTEELPNNIPSINVEVELSVYLDLSKYEGKDGKQVSIHMDKYDALLETRTITITIYNKATDLTVPSNSNIKAETSVAVDISANLVTGYVAGCATSEVIYRFDENENYNEYYLVMGDELQRIVLYTPNHDTIEYSLSAINDNANKLVAKQKDLNPEFSIWDLFDIIITHEQTTNPTGYKYNLNLRLKDEFKYLDLKDQTNKEWRFKVLISANGGELEKPVEFAYVPQRLNSLRIENYSNLAVKTGSTGGTVAEFMLNHTESSLIIPGESGLIKIFAEYNYSYFENIKINSTTQVINGKTYFVKFQQMVYNRTNNTYHSLTGVTADGSSLTLRKVTYVDNGNNIDDEYDGTIFVRTILEKFAGERKSFTITVDAETYDINMNKLNVSRDKTVISQYRPGVHVSVTNALEDVYTTNVGGTTQSQSIYLVEQGTQVSMIEAVVQGYEYNVQPTYNILKFNGSDWNDNSAWVSVTEGIALIKQFGTETTGDGSAVIKYLLKLSKNVTQPFKIVLNVRLIDNGNELTEASETLLFCPVPFIPKNVSLQGMTSDDFVVPVNTSKTLNLTWNTMSPTLSDETLAKINEALVPSRVNMLDMFYINSVDGKKYFRDFVKTGTEEDADKSFLITGKNNKYAIEAHKNEDPIKVHFNLWYKYIFKTADNGALEEIDVEFSTTPSTHMLSYSFDLCLTLHTTEDAPTPIYDVGDLVALGDGANGILMNDIVINLDDNSDIDSEGKTVSLGPWKPLTSSIASLDGNGKIISFTGNVLNVEVKAATDGNDMNVGLLFESIDEDTILKNIAINISGLGDSELHVLHIKDDNVPETSINFGLLAGESNGLIYNCEIISKTTKTLELIVGDKYDLTFGGLVGVNNCNITNSRVGTEYFERITAIDGGYASSKETCRPINFRSSGRMGGLVGENGSGAIISSSFVANTTIENHSNIGDTSRTRTAGFAATNDGTIAYSYVKGVENTILETHLRTNKGMVYASGAGSVAGFVYYNGGTIHDCYSNIECKSVSSAVAGFVYDTSSGEVYQCYSASKVDSIEDSALATELPFIGVGIDENNAQQLLSSKDVVSCYYLKGDVDYDNNYLVDENDVQPKGLSENGFINTSNLNNFSFVEYGTFEQKINGVWTTSTAVDRNRSTYALGTTVLPELTSANQIARSVRVLVSGVGYGEDKTINEYKYVTNYEKGSQNNPYIIRSAQEYEDVFVNGEKTLETDTDADGFDDKKYIVANVRFINDIDFGATIGENTQYIDIGTRDNYVLGSSNSDSNNNPVLTVVDGNGMTISNIAINYAKNETNSKLGLFSEIEYSVIKGLTLKYADNGGDTTATYVGGVAGTAHDTYMIDLTLDNSVELRGNNIVGGVVGKLTGEQSGLFNISSNLSVSSGYLDYNYAYNESVEQGTIEDKYVSYAGGIVGVITIDDEKDSNNAEIHIGKLTVNGANVEAQRAGGVAGYVGKNIDAKRLTYQIGGNSQICGSIVAGGLIAENYADIQLSQVNSASIDTQYGYDKHFGEYINSVDNVETDENGVETVQYQSIDRNDKNYGNLSAVVGGGVIGGFIGKNFGGDINDSLTKANISHETNIAANDLNFTTYDWNKNTIIGGFIGEAYGGNITNVYAQNYIQLNYVEDGKTVYAGTVGGLIGKASQFATQNKFGMDNVVALNFFDKAEVERASTKLTDSYGNPVTDNNGNIEFESKQNVRYVVGEVAPGVENCLNTKSNAQANSAVVTYGVFNANESDTDAYKDNKITRGQVASAQSVNMQLLYKDGSSEQQDIFNILFASWDSSVWEKIYTKYTPNLILDNTNDYYVIDGPEDLKQMEYDPDGNFILTEDVDVNAGNYVVFNEFRGSLFGVKKMDASNNSTSFRYTRFNITLSPDAADHNGAGFFRKTIGARIGNIGFNYLKVVLNTTDNNKNIYNLFGGVAAEDEDSRFEQIRVTYYTDQSDHADTIQTHTSSGTTIATIGSIVGTATRSEILSCTSNLGYNIKVSTGANVGGLVGYINGNTADNESYVDGLISGSSYSGNMNITGGDANVGGIVADAQYTHISSSTVGVEVKSNADVTADEPDTQETKTVINSINISLNPAVNNNIGGIASSITSSTVGDCYAAVNLLITNHEAATAGTQIIGGIVANAISGVNEEATINNSSAKLIIDKMNVNTAYIGGIVGSASSEPIKITSVASELEIKGTDAGNVATASEPAAGNTSAEVTFDYIKLGGIVGENIGTGELTIQDAVSIMYAKPTYNKTLVGGGIIGHTAAEYSLTNVASMGYIHANSSSNVSTDSALGGLIGAVVNRTTNNNIEQKLPVNGEITTSYAALTLSTAGVFVGEVNEVKHSVHTGGIAGYVKTGSTVAADNVIYSSDYTLALEEHNSFAVAAQNVTANVLTTEIKSTDEAEDQMFINTDSWTRASGNNGTGADKYGLPMPPNTANLLQRLGIWTVTEVISGSATDTKYLYNNGEGKPYYPIKVDDSYINNYTDTQGFNKNSYNYYQFGYNPAKDQGGEHANFTSTNTTFNGVLLGNNVTLENTDVLFNKITKHSAVSNINFILKPAGAAFAGKASVAETNNGTIFMVGVNYQNLALANIFAGIVATNNGVVSNCYNNGVADVAITDNLSIAGLVGENTINAVITDCYFTGVFNKVEVNADADNQAKAGQDDETDDGINSVTLVGSGIADTNKGYIAKTYTGGQTQYVVKTFNDGRHSNVFYDYYATFVYETEPNNNTGTIGSYADLATKGITGYSTIDVQYASNFFAKDEQVKNNLFNSWKVYSMHNWDDIYEVDTTYNYGYPVKPIKQKWYNGTIEDIPAIRAKMTGNGTFNEVTSTDKVLGKKVVHTVNSTVKATFDSNPFLISNLGVLSLINKILPTTDASGNNVSGTNGKYFELENNITMFDPKDARLLKQDKDELLTGGPQIGKVDNPFEGVFTSAPGALAAGETAYKYDDHLAKSEELETKEVKYTYDNNSLIVISDEDRKVDNRKIISNLYGRALFACVGNGAVIANIQLTGVMTADAPLISYVGYSEDGSKLSTSTVYNVRVGAVSAVSGGDKKAGFVHTVRKGATLELKQISSNVVFTTNGSTEIAAGVVAVNSGTINASIGRLSVEMGSDTNIENAVAGFAGTNNGSITTGSLTLILKDSKKIASASGLVHENKGEITADDVTIEAEKIEIATLAGLVNIMNGGEITAKDIIYNTKDELKASIFGGAVASLNGGNVVCVNVKAFDGSEIESTTDVFGGLVAIANGGSIKGTIASNITINGNDSDDSAYGFVIGQYKAKTNINYQVGTDIAFNAVDGVNVGGVIGLATCGELNFTSETNTHPNPITVSGAGNVGGFIGLYTAEASLNFDGSSQTWLVDGTKYAKVGVATTSGNADETFSNFGGLIGCWGVKTPSINEAIAITNANEVLTEDVYDSTSGEFNIAYTAGRYVKNKNFTITNVGGVVGLYNATSVSSNKLANTATIGAKIDNTTPSNTNGNPIQGAGNSGSLYKMHQLKNVGGIFGCVGKETQSTQSNDTHIFENADAYTAHDQMKYPITLTNANNTGSVYGMTAVGGLIGYAGCPVKLTIDGSAATPAPAVDSVANTTSQTEIVGIFDVGGLIGYVADVVDISGDTNEGSNNKRYVVDNVNITGLVNVGGLVGWANDLHVNHAQVGATTPEGATTATSMKIKGNIYVGGVAGYISIATLSNINITTATEVYGTVFAYDYSAETSIGSHIYSTYTAHYLPTYIGGVAGHIKQTHIYETTARDDKGYSIYYNVHATHIKSVKTYAKVATDEQFIIAGKYNSYVQVNMNTNYYANTSNATRNLGKYFTANLQPYNTITGGIGGFIGSVNATILKGNIVNKNVNEIIAVGLGDGNTVSGEVYAPYGINVGGLFGNIEGNFGDVNMPTMKDARVQGKVFIGAFVGKCDYVSKLAAPNSDGNRATKDVTIPESSVSVQGYKDSAGNEHTMSGYCVGGVIGYVKQDVTKLKLTSNEAKKYISIFNKDSTHVGALVGRLDGKMVDCSIAPELCGAYEYICNTDDINYYIQYYAPYMVGKSNGYEDGDNYAVSMIQTPTEYNYGGFVGLLNVKKDSNVTVTGDHYYAFTVDCVQNYNMGEGTTEYAYEERDDYNVLAALAHYVNNAQMTISISSLNDLYDKFFTCSGTDYTPGSDIASFDHNPTRSDARGWAAEYTMFRAMTRAIDQTSQSVSVKRETGDSVQTIYCADYITGVGISIADAGEFKEKRTVKTSGNETKETTPKIRKESEIVYTIYQPAGQPAKLYCQYGIATESGSNEEKSQEFTYNDTKNNTKYTYITNNREVEYKELAADSGDYNPIKLHVDNIDISKIKDDSGAQAISKEQALLAYTQMSLGAGLIKQEGLPNPSYWTYDFDYVSTNTLWKDYADITPTEEDKIFKFTTVFGSRVKDDNTGRDELKINLKYLVKDQKYEVGDSSTVVVYSKADFSPTGSIFDVCGKSYDFMVNLHFGEDYQFNDWDKFWQNWSNTWDYNWEYYDRHFILGSGPGFVMDMLGGGRGHDPEYSNLGDAEITAYKTASNIKDAGISTSHDMFNHISSNSKDLKYGALQTVYTKNIINTGSEITTENDDVRTFVVDGMTLAYVACGSRYTVPHDYNSTTTITYNGTQVDIPKYQIEGGELYIHPNSGDTTNVLISNVDKAKDELFSLYDDEGNEEDTFDTHFHKAVDYILSPDGSMIYLGKPYNNVPQISSNLITDSNIADHIRNTYNISNVTTQEVEFNIAEGEGVNSVHNMKLNVDELRWTQTGYVANPTTGLINVRFDYYTTDVPSDGIFYVEAKNEEGKNIYYTKNSNHNSVTGLGEINNNHTFTFAMYSANSINKTGATNEDVGNTKSYHLNYTSSNGMICQTIEYYLYYPKNDIKSSGQWVMVAGYIYDKNGIRLDPLKVKQALGDNYKGHSEGTNKVTIDGNEVELMENYRLSDDGKKLQVYKTLHDYACDDTYKDKGFTFIYERVMTQNVNNKNLLNYNKYVYTNGDAILYTRYFYGEDFFNVEIKDEENSKFIHEILTKPNLILSESVRVTLNNGKLTAGLPSYVTTS